MAVTSKYTQFDAALKNDSPYEDFEITLVGHHVPPRPHHRLFLPGLSGMAVTEACEYYILLEEVFNDLEKMVRDMKEEKEALSRVIGEMAWASGKLGGRHFIASGRVWRMRNPDDDELFTGVEMLGKADTF